MAPHTPHRRGASGGIGAGGEAEKTDDVMKQKMENDTASFAKSIAEKRNRNVEWAESAVRESASITAEEALDMKVIDLIATTCRTCSSNWMAAKSNGKTLNTAKATRRGNSDECHSNDCFPTVPGGRK